MKALTIYQPWARCIAQGEIPLQPRVAVAREEAGLPPLVPKRIENRDRKPPAAMIGKLFAIHAGKHVDEGAVAELRKAGILLPDRFSHGVVAVARLVGVLGPGCKAGELMEEQVFWFVGPYVWLLADVVPVQPPIPTRGYPRHGWDLPPEVVRAIEAQGIATGEGGGS